MRTIIFLCLSILFLPLTLAAEGLIVAGGTLNTDYSYENNVYTVLSDRALTFSGTTTTDRIAIGEGVTASVTLNGVNIDLSNTSQDPTLQDPSFHINKNAQTTLTIKDNNILKSGARNAGIRLSDGSSLKITAASTTPKLEIYGGDEYWGGEGLGIGNNYDETIGNASVQIINGTIITTGTAIAYKPSPGIGFYGNFNLTVILSGGIITAKNGHWEGNEDIKGNVILEGGTIAEKTRISGVISFNKTNCSFPSGTLIFKNQMTLIEDYSNFTLSGNITVKNGTYTNCTFLDNIKVKSGSFSSCTFKDNTKIQGGSFSSCFFNGNITLYDGSSTDKTSVDGNVCSIYSGNWDFNGGAKGSAGIHSKNVYIYGGTISAVGAQGCAGIGGNNAENGKNVTIYGGFVNAYGYFGAGIGGGDGYSGWGNGGTTLIYGGTIEANSAGERNGIGGGRSSNNNGTTKIYGGTVKASIGGDPIIDEGTRVYKGILNDIDAFTSISIDGKPYYLENSHKNDKNLYLYMTGGTHTVYVKNDKTLISYEASYVSGGVSSDGDRNGYFSFSNKQTTNLTNISNVTSTGIGADNSFTYGNEVSFSGNLLFTETGGTEPTISRITNAMNSVKIILTEKGKTLPLRIYQEAVSSTTQSYSLSYEGLDAGEYTLHTQYGGSTTSLPSNVLTANLTIDKATPTYNEPTGLTAIYGQTLNDIIFPYGWAWNDPTATVGNVSSSPNKFPATFTPGDTKNYKTVEIDLSVTVSKVTPSYTIPTGLTATYGQTLENVSLNEGWAWKAPTTPVGNVSTPPNSFPAIFTPTDADNYNTVEANLSVTVGKATLTANDFIYADPTDLVYNGSKKEATVTAKSGLTGTGNNITIKYYKGSEITTTDPIEAGKYTVKIDVDEGSNYNSITDLEVGSFTVIPKEYTITIDPAITNGTVIVDKQQAAENETVTLTVTPATGYKRDLLSYTAGSQTETITGNTFLMPASDVTVTATFKTSSVPPVNPPVDPDDPDPVRYTVTLPTVEGATTDPAAGNYEVDSWGSFSFLLSLNEGYQKDSHPVVTARGEVIAPNTSNGKYIINYVRNDIAIEISGISKDIATGNEGLSEGFHIATSDGLLLVTVPRVTRLYLTDTSGRLILTRLLPAGDTRIEGLAAGVYILTLEGEKGRKVILK